jgi:hypothetical protein
MAHSKRRGRRPIRPESIERRRIENEPLRKLMFSRRKPIEEEPKPKQITIIELNRIFKIV